MLVKPVGSYLAALCLPRSDARFWPRRKLPGPDGMISRQAGSRRWAGRVK